MHIKITYRSKTKSIPFISEYLCYEILEHEIKSIFSLHGQHLLLYYIDEDNVKITLMQDSDIEMMASSNPECQVYRITAENSQEVLFGAKNLEVLKRRYLHQLNRKYYGQKSDNYEEFKTEIRNIQDYLLSCGMDENLVIDVIQFLSRNTGLEIMDQIMLSEIDSGKDYSDSPAKLPRNLIDNISVSTITKPDQSSRLSFISKTDAAEGLFEARRSDPDDLLKDKSNEEVQNSRLQGDALDKEDEYYYDPPADCIEKLRGSNGYRYNKLQTVQRSLKLDKNKGRGPGEKSTNGGIFNLRKLSRVYEGLKSKIFGKN
jgi:hypothetical protein